MFPHPLVRLLLLILLAALLPALELPALMIVLAAILAICLRSNAGDWRRLVNALYRLRWLLASILVVHLGFAGDGVAVLDGSIWLPAPAAVRLACEHVALLVVLLAAVELMRQTTPAAEVAASLVRLLEPLRAAGADTRRFALRLALTMEAVPECGRLLSEYTRERRIHKRGLRAWADTAAELVRVTELRAAEGACGGATELPVLQPAAVRDWLAFGVAATALVLLSVS
ncbi:MAG: hypothetical protein ACREVN_12555 [Gammaproteobacteria bacterium]